jgi:tetratricopeptide (TPR) repeat protein
MTWNNLDIAYERQQQLDRAEAAYREVLAIGTGEGGAHLPAAERQLAAVRGSINLGKLLGLRRHWGEAEAAYREAARISQRLVDDRLQLPESRHGLAIAWNNLGDLYRLLGRSGEAEKALHKAVAVWGQALQDARNDLLARGELARSLTNLGDLYGVTRRLAEAEAAYQKASPVATEAARASPAVLEFQTRVGWLHARLGACCQLTGRWARAESLYREALTGFERLARDHPGNLSLATGPVEVQAYLATLALDAGQAGVALERYGQAIRPLEEMLARNSRLPLVRRLLSALYAGRAIVQAQSGHPAEAAADWDRALRLDDGAFRHLLAFARAYTRARLPGPDPAPLYREHYAAAAAELDALDFQIVLVGSTLSAYAPVYALSGAAAAQDDRLPPAERRQRAERYAARAVEFLRRARDAGYFRPPGRVEGLKHDPGLDPLRARPDFRQIQAELERSPAPGREGL